MRRASFLLLVAVLIPAVLSAKTFNQMDVLQVEGTVMVQPGDGSAPYALQTGSSVTKGDTVTCYDKSWVILKSHKGDEVGLNGYKGLTVINLDEYYIEGPDRQIRLVLQKGTLMLRTNGSGSRQSFFEINSGSLVSAVGDTQAILTYDPAGEHLKVQYIRGKLSVIDKNSEHKFGVQPTFGSGKVVNIRDKASVTDAEGETAEYIPEASEYNWKNGVLADDKPNPMDALDADNYKRFFNMEPPLNQQENNLLLRGSD